MPLLAPRALNGLYSFCEPLAEGSFGSLYVAIHNITGQKVAVKILDKSKLGTDTFRVRSEIEALKQLNHKYIYKLYQVVETKYYFYLVLEYLPGGELFDYILQKEYLPESEARVIFRQIVSAIGFAHSRGFYHRDLKPENILLDAEKNVRIIDFGLCAKNPNNMLLNTFCGSFAYAAPEVLANKEYNGGAADVWSLGVILYALLCGCLPFDPTKPEELPQKIGKGHFTVPSNLSKSSIQLLTQLMCVDPRKRIKMEELRRHPWIVDGFLGFPVEFDEEKVPMHPLNMRIVKEISDYTGIPKNEMARMLQQRSYDYLMATYMIMETVYEDENDFISLKDRRRALATPHSHASFARSDPSALDSNPRRKRISSESSTRQHFDTLNSRSCLSSSVSFERLSSGKDEKDSQSELRSSLSLENTYYGTAPLTKATSRPNASVSTTLSPSRSMDSQLPHLVEGLNNIRLFDASIPDSSDENDHAKRISLSSTSSSLPPNFSCSDHASNDGATTPPPPTEAANSASMHSPGWRQLGRFRDALKTKKSSKTVPDQASHSRLRKTRHLNNVFLVRRNLTATQVLDQVAAALRQHSIRFTLKGSGFMCVITNDWGKTVLSFEMELVQVSNRNVEPISTGSVKRRMTIKARPTIKPPTSVVLQSKRSHDNVSTQSKDVSSSSLSNSAQPDSGSARLGIKIKRLRGDSFMYASLCRTILSMSNVKDTL